MKFVSNFFTFYCVSVIFLFSCIPSRCQCDRNATTVTRIENTTDPTPQKNSVHENVTKISSATANVTEIPSKVTKIHSDLANVTKIPPGPVNDTKSLSVPVNYTEISPVLVNDTERSPAPLKTRKTVSTPVQWTTILHTYKNVTEVYPARDNFTIIPSNFENVTNSTFVPVKATTPPYNPENVTNPTSLPTKVTKAPIPGNWTNTTFARVIPTIISSERGNFSKNRSVRGKSSIPGNIKKTTPTPVNGRKNLSKPPKAKKTTLLPTKMTKLPFGRVTGRKTSLVPAKVTKKPSIPKNAKKTSAIPANVTKIPSTPKKAKKTSSVPTKVTKIPSSNSKNTNKNSHVPAKVTKVPSTPKNANKTSVPAKVTKIPSDILNVTKSPNISTSSTKIPPFSENVSSSIVDLRSRALTKIPKKIWRYHEAKSLDLDHNKLTNLPIELAKLEKLEHIDLNDNLIGNISTILVLNELAHLESLNVSKNPIKSLQGLEIRSLENLQANNCKLKEIDGLVLAALPSLRVLNLTGNPLETARELSNKNLTDLILKDCRIKELSADTLKGLENLRYLDLCGNKLISLPDKIFLNNNNLVRLILRKNKLQNVKSAWFEGKQSLRKIDLSENEIKTINETIFAKLLALVDLDFGGNKVVAFPKLKASAINVNFSKNLIVNQQLFDLMDMRKIRSLDLSKNRFQGECDKFRSESLRVLDLSNNNLTRVRRDTFTEVPNLMTLKLRGNRLTEGANLIFEENKILVDIDLMENPWDCNCSDLYPAFSYLTRGQRVKATNLICFTPERARGQPWWSVCSHDWKNIMNIGERRDSSKIWLIILATIFGLSLLAGTIVYIVFTVKKN